MAILPPGMAQAFTSSDSRTRMLQAHSRVSGRISTAWATMREVMRSTRETSDGSPSSLPSCAKLWSLLV